MIHFTEKTVQFGREKHLNGVLTLPKRADGGLRACFVMVNAGIVHRVGCSRMYVQLARTLSRFGVGCLRFDLSGLGESDLPVEAIGVQETVDADLQNALAFVEQKVGKVPLVGLGLCSGAHDLVRAIRAEAKLAGVVLLDLFGEYKNSSHLLRHYAARATRAQSWMNALSNPVRAITDAGKRIAATGEEGRETGSAATGVRPMLSRRDLTNVLDRIISDGPDALFVFTAGLEEYYNYQGQFGDVFPMHAKSSKVSWAYFPDANHMFTTESARRALSETIRGWLCERGWADADQSP